MPWCPNCKNEYKAGYTVCADCGAALVESLGEGEMKAVYFGAEAELHAICDFMRVNGIPKTKISYDEKDDTYELLVEPKAMTEAQNMIRVYLQNAASKAAQMQDSMSEEEKTAMMQERDARIKEMLRTPYEDAGKKAEDYKAGAYLLISFGVVGVMALILLHLGVIPISLTGFSKGMITVVMGILFVIFIVAGISSVNSYKKIKSQADTDKDTKEEIRKYLLDSIDVEEFDQDLTEDNPSMEILYFRRMEKMKEMVSAYMEGIDVSFEEYILEELYPEIFE